MYCLGVWPEFTYFFYEREAIQALKEEKGEGELVFEQHDTDLEAETAFTAEVLAGKVDILDKNGRCRIHIHPEDLEHVVINHETRKPRGKNGEE